MVSVLRPMWYPCGDQHGLNVETSMAYCTYRNVRLIRLRHVDDDDTSPGGHAKNNGSGDGDGDDDGDGDGYGEIMANLMVLAVAKAMMMMTTVVIHTRQRSQHCNLIFFL